MAGLKLAANIKTYNSMGVEASNDGFSLGRKPTLIQIKANELSNTMYMFSPEWQKVQGAWKGRESELLLTIEEQDSL